MRTNIPNLSVFLLFFLSLLLPNGASAVNIFTFDGACFRQCSFMGLQEKERLDGFVDFLDFIDTSENSTYNSGPYPIEEFSFLGDSLPIAPDQRPFAFHIENDAVRWLNDAIIDFEGIPEFDRVLIDEIFLTELTAIEFGVDHLFADDGQITEITFATVNGPTNTTVYSAIGRFVRPSDGSESGSGANGSGSNDTAQSGTVPAPSLPLLLLAGAICFWLTRRRNTA